MLVRMLLDWANPRLPFFMPLLSWRVMTFEQIPLSVLEVRPVLQELASEHQDRFMT